MRVTVLANLLEGEGKGVMCALIRGRFYALFGIGRNLALD
jgi:hypothetical protein